jgi:hypothetical protein
VLLLAAELQVDAGRVEGILLVALELRAQLVRQRSELDDLHEPIQAHRRTRFTPALIGGY